MQTIIYSQSFKEFLKSSDCRIAKILIKIYDKEYYYRNDSYTTSILTNNELNYITFRKDGTISYLPNGKELKYNDDGEWSKDGRQNGKPSKVIRKIFTVSAIHKLKLKDADFECFTNSYKAQFSEDGYKFEIMDNSEIPGIYCADRMIGGGTLNNSCMNGDESYLDIYKNCDSLQILTMKNKAGLLAGRALVWNVDNNITLMDRIYVSEDFMYDSFLTFAKNNNWWRKLDYKSYSDKTGVVNDKGETLNKHFTINTDTDFSEFPYIDTFCYGEDGSLNNYGSGQYTYNNTDGTRDGEDSDNDYDEDMIYITRGDSRYRDENYHIDDCVEVDGDWYHVNDSHIVEVDNNYYNKDSDDIVYSSNECEYILYDKAIYVNDEDWYLRSSVNIIETIQDEINESEINVCEIDGDFYLLENCIYSDVHNTYILKSDSIEVCGSIHLRSDFTTQLNLFTQNIAA